MVGCPRQKVRALVFQARSNLAAARAARDTPCREIREHIAMPRGGGIGRSLILRHLAVCEGCREFRDQCAGSAGVSRRCCPSGRRSG